MSMRGHMQRARVAAVTAAVMTLVVVSSAAAAPATQRVSVSSSGAQANGASLVASPGPSLNGNGQFVVFESEASDLVLGDTNHHVDIFVRDRNAGTTSRVSISNSGRQSNGDSYGATISADGRYVAFWSNASNLVAGDTNGAADVFVRDLVNRTTRRVSVSSSGVQGNGGSSTSAIASSGRYVVFSSAASNLVPGDTNHAVDAFIALLGSGKTKRISVSSSGAQANGASAPWSVTPDGRYVGFDSNASNLVSWDTNGYTDVFVRDRVAKTTERVNVSSEGAQGCEYENGSTAYSEGGSISADGRYVVFDSEAACLTENDDSGRFDVFLHDRVTGKTTMVSVSSTGQPGNEGDTNGQISADGGMVVFESDSWNLPGATPGHFQERLYVRNLVTDTIQEVGLTSTGAEPIGDSGYPSLSQNDRYLAFYSFASNLVAGDTNDTRDVFVQNLPAR